MSQVYQTAAHTLYLLESKQGSLKQLCYRLSPVFSRPVYALLVKLLEVKSHLDQLLYERWPHCEERELALVMLFDYLTKGKIRSGGHTKHQIITRFRDTPKLKTTPQTPHFKWIRPNPFLLSPSQLQDKINCIPDSDIPGLFKVTPEELRKITNSAEIIQQDKASCMSVAALELKQGGWSAFDACSAPGNKTLQLAGRMLGLTTGRLYAFERDKDRFQTLSKRIHEFQASNVIPVHKDFLTVTGLQGVKYGIVDPSCSGSGITEHHLVDTGEVRYTVENHSQRVRRLAAFQRKILRHALLIGDLEAVVYSTCSLYRQENEEVVLSTLHSLRPFYRLQPALPSWSRRGLNLPECVRTDPTLDDMTGFFVAVFKRKVHRLRHRLLTRRSMVFAMYRKRYYRELANCKTVLGS